tara:strand:+ start:6497 stop:7324 length:828 start_codon:yes stop_codon:yes gene_type:complete
MRDQIYKIYNILFSKTNSVRYFIKEKYLYLKNKKKSYEILNKDKPLISIIMPTYNRCKILSEIGIPTVLNQTYQNFELLIISHGSTDDTENVVKKINDKRIKYFKISREKKYPPNVENHWACHSVDPTNFGLKQVTGDWISHLDDDDIWTKDHLEKLLNFARENKYEFVSSSHIEKRYGKEKIINFSNEKPPVGSQHTWLYTSNLSFFDRNINSWRRSWNRIHDVDVADRMKKVGLNFGYLNEITYIAQPRPGENQIGIRAMRENKDYYEKLYKF